MLILSITQKRINPHVLVHLELDSADDIEFITNTAQKSLLSPNLSQCWRSTHLFVLYYVSSIVLGDGNIHLFLFLLLIFHQLSLYDLTFQFFNLL
jgi:hypothetical protein